ncbi:IclR family transcriptional regulator [Pelagibacterium lentulum]|uniref:IclR family transcriptional regulator n=1 Tax=Pelagibacterium lentulum TaxID=2029865 RepID=A0A916RMS3_9HYPH|nr:IclR family transcriptional regulator [Pelagibacterium lentulum]GGA62202.1 IclR family transcriptional regulator [Pelagibacterium lentulum]
MKDETGRQRARGIDRAFDILDYLRAARVPQRPAEIALALGAPKSTIYDLISVLSEHGMIEPVGPDGQVYLGRRLYFLGIAYQEQADMIQAATRVLDAVTERTKETSQFCMLDGEKYTVAKLREGSRPFRISANVGERTPIPWTASGRLLLGHMSDTEIIDLIPPDDFILPDGSTLSPQSFIAEIRKASSEGFFSFDSIVDTFTHCFAAPVTDHRGVCVATVCIVAPKEDAQSNYEEYRRVLIEAGSKLSDTPLPRALSG